MSLTPPVTSRGDTSWCRARALTSKARRRSTRASCSRKSSSKTSRRRAGATTSSDSGPWMARKASVRSHRSMEVRHSSGSGSANSPARSSASATNSPISHDVSPALAEAGYTGRIRSVRRPGVTPATTSTTGLVIWRAPRYSVTLPKKIASVPASSCLARQGWLKKTILSRPVSSRTTTSTTALPVPGAPGAAPTAPSASTAASSPTCRSETSAWRVRSM